MSNSSSHNDSSEDVEQSTSFDGNSSSECADLPSGAECRLRCQEFAKVTSTDSALAMFYLQENKWSLEKALDAFYQTTNKDSSKRVVACFDVDQLNQDEKRARTSKDAEETDDDIVEVQDESLKHFKLLSWNIDGLDKGNLEARTIGVTKTIIREEPDVVLLQEVVGKSEEILRRELDKRYDFCSANQQISLMTYRDNANDMNYYTMILCKRKTCSLLSSQVHDFDNSRMGRNLLDAHISYLNGKVKFHAMTAHLESTAEFSKQRIEQLKECFIKMREVDLSEQVFFGGDLNMRDSEINAIGGLPKGIDDLWEATGKRKECLYTWDCSRNTNLTMNTKFKPKLRFDRLYMRKAYSNDQTKSNKQCLMPVYFELEGLEKLKSCGRFCSDHWAIQTYCELENQA